jgi:hypothetical protein
VVDHTDIMTRNGPGPQTRTRPDADARYYAVSDFFGS